MEQLILLSFDLKTSTNFKLIFRKENPVTEVQEFFLEESAWPSG